MMANVTGASLNPIYNRLNSAPEYHPLEADTFADWAVEAGDMVTLTRDGTSYKSPVHEASMNWRRGQEIQLSSTGKQTRSPVSRMTQRKYATGGSGLRNNGYIHMYVTDQYNQLQSGLELTASSAYLYSKDFYKQMESGLKLTASSAHLYTQNMYNQMRTGLHLSESTAILYAQSRTSRAEIITRINEKGQGEALINADNIKLTGGNIKLNDAISVTSILGSQMVWMRKMTYFGSEALFANGMRISNPGNPYVLNAAAIGSMIKSVEAEGNTLTLERFDGTKVNFKKATSITQSWNSGNSSVKATAEGAPTVYYNVDHRFNQHQGGYYVELIHSDSGSTIELSGTGKQIKLGKSGNQVQIQNASGTKYANTPTYNILLQSKVASSNGVVTPDAGYDGLSSVDVQVPASSYVSRNMRCMSIEPTYPGSSTNYYTFRLEGNYSMFSVGTNYAMYRESWY